MSDIAPVIDWLTDGARSASRAEDFVEELCHRMIEGGIPLWRAALFVDTLHPSIFGRRFTWHAGKGVSVFEGLYELMETEEFRKSPVAAVRANGQTLRRHLAQSDCPNDFPILDDLRAEGATDYVAVPMIFTDARPACKPPPIRDTKLNQQTRAMTRSFSADC